MFVIKSLPVQLFFVNDSTPTEIYTLSLHDALPISYRRKRGGTDRADAHPGAQCQRLRGALPALDPRSEEHTSELQSHSDLVCRLLLEKKKGKTRKQQKDNGLSENGVSCT